MSALQQAHRDAIRLPINAVAQKLQETLGQRLSAYAVNIKDPKAVGRYARDESKPREETERRLRELYQICQLLLTRETAETVRAWMIGSNPLLDDKAPIESLHEGALRPILRTAETDAAGSLVESPFPPVIRAAQAFAAAR